MKNHHPFSLLLNNWNRAAELPVGHPWLLDVGRSPVSLCVSLSPLPSVFSARAARVNTRFREYFECPSATESAASSNEVVKMENLLRGSGLSRAGERGRWFFLRRAIVYPPYSFPSSCTLYLSFSPAHFASASVATRITTRSDVAIKHCLPEAFCI